MKNLPTLCIRTDRPSPADRAACHCDGCENYKAGKAKFERTRKPVLCIDFDGVIHDYRRGWMDGTIYGAMTSGFYDWALQANDIFQLVIYSSRSKTPEGIVAMIDFMQKEAIRQGRNWQELAKLFEFADKKPPAFLTIDDRCVRFGGSWSDLVPHDLIKYRTWTQK